jgi:PAS domain S-box-containing protein
MSEQPKTKKKLIEELSFLKQRIRELELSESEHKRAEEALGANERQLTDLIEFLPDATLAIDKEGRVIIWNKAIEEMTGIPAEEIRGKGNYAYAIPFYGEARPQLMDLVFADHEEIAVRYPKITREGDTLMSEVFCSALYDNKGAWVIAKASPLYDQPGNIIGAIESIRDITERKQAEEALRAASRYARNLIETSLDPLITISAEGKITDVNTATEKITGMSRDRLIGSDFSDYFTEPEMARAGYMKVFVQGQVTDYPLAIRHTSGAITEVLYNASVYRNEQGKVLGVFAAARDITERKRAEEETKTKNEELENYLYIASHDLRSPLVNIQGFSQRLQKQTVSLKTLLSDLILAPETKEVIEKITDEGIPKTLNFILSNVTKMDVLLNGLLQISHTGRTVMTIKKIDMNQLFKTVIGTYNYQLTELDAIVTAAALPFCHGDENLLNQMISNIIGNAIKYREKGKTLAIDISADQEFNKVIYSIKDNGIGIDPRHLTKIWNVFYRVDSASWDTGDGLGLSIVKRIVDKHKGRVWAESELGKGSVFFIELQSQEFQK